LNGYDGSVRGRILDIGHGTTKDGPGWRSIVYFMGCNFRCPWCASPQTIESTTQLLVHSDLEKYPDRNAAACPYGAVTVDGEKTRTDRAFCRKCVTFDCVEKCIDGSREYAGKEVGVAEIISELLKYRRFHREYGVTISGGEPTVQWGFFIELLKACKQEGFHTAVETNGSSDKLVEALEYLDLVICDLKHFDSKRHKELTGCSNELVIQNIQSIAKSKKPVWIRIPVIPGVTDGENLDNSAEFLSRLEGDLKVEIIGYHRLGLHTWEALGREYALKDIVPYSETELEEIREKFKSYGLDVIKT